MREEDDPSLRSHPLLLWTAKEAAYKALAPLLQKTLTLKDFWINGGAFGVDGHPPFGDIFIGAQGPLWMATALLQSSSGHAFPSGLKVQSL